MPLPNVLVTAASRRVPLITAFQKAQALTRGGRVIVTDVNPLSAGVHVADDFHRVPLATDPDYVDTLLTVCEAEQIGLLVPTIDDELEVIGAARDRFAERGVMVAASPEATSRVCRDKLETARTLKERSVASAETWLPEELPADPVYPLFIKPRFGRGGVNAFAVRSSRELDFFTGYVEQPIVQRFLDGREFTIDVLCDFNGCPLSIVPRERVVIRAGVIDRGRTVRDGRLIALAQAIVSQIPFIGPLNIQCRVVDDQPVVFEINARFSGGIPLTIAAGADFPRMLLDLTAGRRVRPAIGEFEDDLWLANYEASIFVRGADVSALGNCGRPRIVATQEVA